MQMQRMGKDQLLRKCKSPSLLNLSQNFSLYLEKVVKKLAILFLKGISF